MADVSYRFSFLIIAGWLSVAAILWLALSPLPSLNMSEPSPLPGDTTPLASARQIDRSFTGDAPHTLVYLVVESTHRLGPPDQEYYNAVVRQLRTDADHVACVVAMWSDTLTAKIAESPDGQSSYALVWLDGELGSTTAHTSADAARALIDGIARPPGSHAYLTGLGTAISAPLAITPAAGLKVTVATLAATAALVFVACRPRLRASIALVAAGITILVGTPLIAALDDVLSLSVFSSALTASLAGSAAIAFTLSLTRAYHENRHRGADAINAVRDAYVEVFPHIIIAAAVSALVLSALAFAQIPLLRTAGMPATIGVVLATLVVLTLSPALVSLADRCSAWTQSPPRGGRWPRVSVAAMRRLNPFLAVAVVSAMFVTVPLSGLRSGDDANRLLGGSKTSSGAQFPASRLLPDEVVIQSDRDLRDPAGLIAIDRVTRRILDLPGVRLVQSASWPAGIPWAEATFAFQAGELGKQLQRQVASFATQLTAIKSLTASLDSLGGAVDQLERSMATGVAGLQEVGRAADRVSTGVRNIRDTAGSVSSYLDPIRKWMDGVPNCPTDMLCAAALRVVEPVDSVLSGIDDLSHGAEQLAIGSQSTTAAFATAPYAIAQMRTALNQLRDFMQGLTKTIDSVLPQIVQLTAFLKNVSIDFRASGEGGYYMPREMLNDPSYQQVKHFLFTTDGHATRLFVYGDTDDARLPLHQRSDAIEQAVLDATKYGALLDSTVAITGAGSIAETLQILAVHDVLVLAAAILAVVVLMAGVALSRIGAGLTAGATLLVSYALSLGGVGAVWRYAFGAELHWLAPPLALAVIAALGMPYNIGLIARYRRESDAGANAGLLRSGQNNLGATLLGSGIAFGIALMVADSGTVLSRLER